MSKLKLSQLNLSTGSRLYYVPAFPFSINHAYKLGVGKKGGKAYPTISLDPEIIPSFKVPIQQACRGYDEFIYGKPLFSSCYCLRMVFLLALDTLYVDKGYKVLDSSNFLKIPEDAVFEYLEERMLDAGIQGAHRLDRLVIEAAIRKEPLPENRAPGIIIDLIAGKTLPSFESRMIDYNLVLNHHTRILEEEFNDQIQVSDE